MSNMTKKVMLATTGRVKSIYLWEIIFTSHKIISFRVFQRQHYFFIYMVIEFSICLCALLWDKKKKKKKKK
jgi:hypothetical protein